MNPRTLHLAKQNRRILHLLGLDVRKLSEAEIKEGADIARKVTACGCGADSRRIQATDDWRTFLTRIAARMSETK
jgi:hypothetical protein